LIGIGLVLALLGAGSIMLMTQGISHLYVGCYSFGLAELLAFVIGGGVFLRYYGRYLDRLEAWTAVLFHSEAGADAEQVTQAAVLSESTSPADAATQPMRTSAVVALSACAFGVVIIVGGIIFTVGSDLVLNLLGGAAFLAGSGIIWWMGRDASARREIEVGN
jgi:hypothetical protein